MAAVVAGSSVHRALGIPELLYTIFRYMDHPCNASNARVCRKWSEIALDTLWRTVDDLNRLFGLLVPTKEVDGEFVFTRLPESADWKQFEKYTRRVRELSFNAQKASRKLRQGVFDELARTRTSLNILPNMHSLEWNAPLGLCVMFMHSNVKRFVVHLPSPDAVSLPSFFQDVVARMPNITHLDIRSQIPMNVIENSVCKLLRGMTKLRKITFPRFYLTSRVVEALSQLEHLGVIEFQYYEAQGFGDPDDTIVFGPSLEQPSFPALWDLSMTVEFLNAARFIDMPFAPTNLTMLYIDSQYIETPSDVHHLLNTIAENCQLLEFLALISFRDASPEHLTVPTPTDCIGFDIIKPLLKCPNLNSLEIIHQYPLTLQQQDLEALASSWPSLESLVLNNEPVYLHHSNLTLHALLPFAQHCPKLRQLGLFIHASTANLQPTAQKKPHTDYVPFKNLQRLSMGVSIISEEGPVALFLSQICPLACEMDCGVTWDISSSMVLEVEEQIKERCERWTKVSELLPLLIKLRMEERDRTRALQSEVQDLRIRTGVMLDNAKLLTSDACISF